MKIESLEQLERLLQLVSNYKLDALEVDGIRIVKTKHDFTTIQPAKSKDDNDDLFWSADQG